MTSIDRLQFVPIFRSMPLYEYRCLDCEKVHEAIQKFSDAPLETCPTCQGTLTKLMSMSSFSLKGTGWYTTDYKKSSAPSGVGTSEQSKDSANASSVSSVKDGNEKTPSAKENKTENSAAAPS